MKKVLGLMAMAILAASVANAQLQKGNVLVGGDISDFNLGLDKGSNFTMSINPKAAWFIQDNLSVGATVGFGLITAKGASTTTTYMVGGLARYYANNRDINILRHGRWFVEGTAGVGGTNYAGTSTNGLSLGIGPGYAYFVTPNIGIEGLLKYNGIVGFGSAATSNNLNLSVGFQIYLPGRATRNIRSEKNKPI